MEYLLGAQYGNQLPSGILICTVCLLRSLLVTLFCYTYSTAVVCTMYVCIYRTFVCVAQLMNQNFRFSSPDSIRVLKSLSTLPYCFNQL